MCYVGAYSQSLLKVMSIGAFEIDVFSFKDKGASQLSALTNMFRTISRTNKTMRYIFTKFEFKLKIEMRVKAVNATSGFKSKQISPKIAQLGGSFT